MLCRRSATLLTAFILSVKGAHAQTPAESSLADALYRQGRQLMTEGNYAEACPKFAESYRLDPATGTLLNLAACHEGEQKYATASLEYSDAAARAQRDHRDDRIRFAQARLAAIEPKVSHVRVVLTPGLDGASIETELDGAPVREAARNVPLPVDPGEHVVVAHAAGFKPWAQRVVIERESTEITVAVPALASESTAATTEADRPAVAAPSAAPPVQGSVYVSGAITLALTTGAIATGAVYVARYAQYGNVQPADRASKTRGWGVANAVFTGGALVAAGVTLYLYWNRPSTASTGVGISKAAIVPWVDASSAGLSVQGTL
ncbi:MAG TPA: hypothetical protein VGL13_15435 [Polyangiaceae bacterium]